MSTESSSKGGARTTAPSVRIVPPERRRPVPGSNHSTEACGPVQGAKLDLDGPSHRQIGDSETTVRGHGRRDPVEAARLAETARTPAGARGRGRDRSRAARGRSRPSAPSPGSRAARGRPPSPPRTARWDDFPCSGRCRRRAPTNRPGGGSAAGWRCARLHRSIRSGRRARAGRAASRRSAPDGPRRRCR